MKKKKLSVLLCAVLIVSFFTCAIINWHLKYKVVSADETSYQQDKELNEMSETEIEKVEYDGDGKVNYDSGNTKVEKRELSATELEQEDKSSDEIGETEIEKVEYDENGTVIKRENVNDLK